jgi:hypothetical protein
MTIATDFSTRCFNALERALLLAVCILMLVMPASAANESVSVQSAELKLAGDSWMLNADFNLQLNRTQEEALKKGVTLHFVTDFELERVRSWWLNETLAEANRIGRLNYSPLTRRFQVETLEGYKAYDTLHEALAGLGHLEDWAVAPKKMLKPGERYLAAVRMRLDLGLLSKPLQINALATGKWEVEGDWHEWEVAP